MKYAFMLLIAAIMFSSCETYKSGSGCPASKGYDGAPKGKKNGASSNSRNRRWGNTQF
jgi:hypothetical protein